MSKKLPGQSKELQRIKKKIHMRRSKISKVQSEKTRRLKNLKGEQLNTKASTDLQKNLPPNNGNYKKFKKLNKLLEQRESTQITSNKKDLEQNQQQNEKIHLKETELKKELPEKILEQSNLIILISQKEEKEEIEKEEMEKKEIEKEEMEKKEMENGSDDEEELNHSQCSIKSSFFSKLGNGQEISSIEEMLSYYKLQSKKTIRFYGKFIIENMLKMEEDQKVSSSFINKHKISKDSRKKITEWMYEICKQAELDQKAFYLSVYLADRYLDKIAQREFTKTQLTDIAITCIVIASKVDSTKLVAFHQFLLRHEGENNERNAESDENSDQRIQNLLGKEMEILQTLNFRTCYTSVYEFLSSLFCDLSANKNYEFQNKFEVENYLFVFENCCVFLSEFIMLWDYFSTITISNAGLACLIVGFEMLKTFSKNVQGEVICFLDRWIRNLIYQLKKSEKELEKICNKIKKCWEKCKSPRQETAVHRMHEIKFD